MCFMLIKENMKHWESESIFMHANTEKEKVVLPNQWTLVVTVTKTVSLWEKGSEFLISRTS